MAEQRVHRRGANFQQRKQRNVKLSDIAQLHQRGFSTLQPFTLQRGRQVIDVDIQLPIANLMIAINHRNCVAACVAGQHFGKRQILPIAFFTVARRQRVRPAGKFHGHSDSLMQAENVQHGRELDARFAPLGLRR